MKTLAKTSLLLATLLLLATNSWALNVNPGDTVIMYNYGQNYTLEDVTTSTTFSSFCVEKTEYFYPGQTHTVDSVGLEAIGGGTNYGIAGPNGGDMISDETIWLFASFWDGLFGAQTDTLADTVQNAIWFAEDEIIDSTAFDNLTALANNDFSVNGWDIQVVNLLYNGRYAQSQLVGAPVPEPSTMLLLGSGLLGLAYYKRRKS